ncbi:ABC2 homolog 9 [Actinidia rufa]|uniref:ABC2 homolog 9 n=1 Tax=Actinidia rufa TaxID=165716 RepID=A0A7J0EF54_9ERIC|nr:ABC2 homolog 9 [Actinidia rufa]
MAGRFLLGATRKLALASGVVTVAAIETSDDPATVLKLCTTVPLRLARLSVTAATIAFGVKLSRRNLVGSRMKFFREFVPVPTASASLAQVHVAHTHDGQKVAVKVQHTHMTDTVAADYATVELIVNTLHRFFPTFDYRWLVDEVRESLPKASYLTP